MLTTIRSYDASFWSSRVPKFRTTERAKSWMKRYGWSRLPVNIERVFLKDAHDCVEYARRIGSRLPKEYEDFIMNFSTDLALDYLTNVVRGPLPEYEDCIKTTEGLVTYAKDVIRGRLPEHLEIKLIGDPYECFEYAWGVLEGRLPESLHNYMYGASMDDSVKSIHRGYGVYKMDELDYYSSTEGGPKEYFEFIKVQRKNLYRLVSHYAKVYELDTSKSIGNLLCELKNGR